MNGPVRLVLLAGATLLAAYSPTTEPIVRDIDGFSLVSATASVHGALPVEICKYGPEGTNATFSVQVSGAAGTLPLRANLTLSACPTAYNGYNCRWFFVASDTGTSAPQNSVLTVTETGATEGCIWSAW